MIQPGLPGFDVAPGRTDGAATLAALEVDYTPVAVAVQLLLALAAELAPAFEPRHIYDPAAGSGCWGRAMRAIWPDAHLTGCDTRESEATNLRAAYDAAILGDGCQGAAGRMFDLIATNPPFSAFAEGWAQAFRRAHALTAGGVVALYGLSQFGQAAEHRELFRSWCPFLQIRVGGRVAHRGDGQADQREYSLWCWSMSAPAPVRLSWRTVQLPALPSALRRWSPLHVPGTFPLDAALVAEIREYL